MASGTYCVPGSTRRQKPFAEVRGPMTISDEDLIECWFCRLAAPEIVTKLGLQSTSELRLLWRRLKELGKLPLSSREEFGRDLLLERLIKVHREPRELPPQLDDMGSAGVPHGSSALFHHLSGYP